MNEEVDDARPEATFEFRVDKFSQLKDSVLSEATYVRNLPWKIMIMPRNAANTKSVGYFLQCNGESEAASWSCQASAELRILHPEEPPFSRKISHLFFAKENDWGFSHYMTWSEVMDPNKGYYDASSDSVTFQVKVLADAPHGVSWDSKKHTGYVGLKNQGATCYMNSLLQVLYFSNALRKSVYKMPTEADDSSKSVALALQRVFNDLQFLDKAVGTKKLTKSFGWETLDSFMQHDVQEFLRVLLDKLEMKMKGTVVEGTIPRLFEGKMISYIKCKNVDYTSSRTESFYDIQLNIKGKKNILESFEDYVTTETLEGENKYDAGGYGFQEAEKGILFESFPPILHLHLMRFQYDPLTDCSVKFNDRFEFPEVLDLTKFLKHKEEEEEAMDVDNDEAGNSDSMVYILHAVLVHSGDNHGGHYVVFINPKGDGKWCKFDDDVVSRCTCQEAIQYNFGGSDDDSNTRQSTNAYMLVYIRKSSLHNILCEVSDADIPDELSDRLEKEKKLEMARRKEKSEAHLYMIVRIITEDSFIGHQGNDLYDPDRAVYYELKVRKTDTVLDVLDSISEQFNQPKDRIRLWPMQHRANQTFRTCILDLSLEGKKQLNETNLHTNPWTVFLDIKNPEVPGPLKHFHKENDVLLFFKFYDPRKEKIYYKGHLHVSISATFSEIIPELLRRSHLSPDTKLLLHEEVQPNMLEIIEDLDKPLETVLEDLLDGDIIVYQKALSKEASQSLQLPTSFDYFKDFYNKVEVTFVDKNLSNDPGFSLVLSQSMNYESFSKALGDKLGVSPELLQFFKSQSYRDAPNTALRCSFDGTLKDLLSLSKPKTPRKIFYQRLSIPVHEMENKRQFKVSWGEESELLLYPVKTGCVGDLLAEARGQVVPTISPETPLRLLEIISNKIVNVAQEETLLEVFSSFQNKTYRLEEVPEDQRTLRDNELLVPVAHFHKDIYSTFGSPFLLKISDGSTFEEIRAKIQKHLGVADKEFEKYRLGVVLVNRLKYIDENNFDDLVKIKTFLAGGQGGNSAKPWIGLEHVNKSSKRPRYNYMEKAIKIYN